MKKHTFGKIFSGVYSVLIFAFLYLPIVVLIVFSFNNSKSRGHWGGFTLKWYESLFSDSETLGALGTTVLLALLSAIIATIIGTFAAIGISTLNRRLRGMIMNVSYLPMLNPDIVTGISLLLLFVFCSVGLGFKTLLLAHVAFNIPYVLLSVMPRLQTMNTSIYEAALDLGCTPMKAIFRVMLPELRPGILTGFLLAITMSIDDFVISYFTTGPGVETLSISIYMMARRGIKPEINALSAILFVTVLALLILVNLRNAKAAKKSGETVRRGESRR